jgi:GT2 family glycosyltransferase
MSQPIVSVIIPSHNRGDRLPGTLAALGKQSLPEAAYEIVVVDDGSTPPVILSPTESGPRLLLIRTAGVERSAARNAGAVGSRGRLLVFLDDDIHVGPEFLTKYLTAHAEWPDALLVGSIRLPDAALATPFGHFRQQLEQQEVPMVRGPITARNFCTAANMAIARERFDRLGGFDATLVSAEDQDLALRHTAAGGRIAFVPEAEGVHQDGALDIASYCRRVEWGSEKMVLFCRRHPDWPDNRQRQRVNGFIDANSEPLGARLRKLAKSALATTPVIVGLLAMARMLEYGTRPSRVLDRVYRLLLGAHIFRGFRTGLRQQKPCPQQHLEGEASRLIASCTSPGTATLRGGPQQAQTKLYQDILYHQEEHHETGR